MPPSGPHRSALAGFLGAVALCLFFCAASLAAASPRCTLKANERALSSPPLDEPVTLSLQSQSDPILNFGEDRGLKVDYVVLKAVPPLPPEVVPEHLELDSLSPMKRIGGDNLESTRLEFPRFIPPRILAHGEKVSFGICVNGAGGDPGTYTGQVEVNGPAGLSPLQLTQTAQLKAKFFGLFGALYLGVLMLASFFIWRRVGRETNATGGKKRGAQLTVVLISVGAAGWAMWKVYNDDPAWGADWFSSLAALGATGFAAGGIGTTVSAMAGFITGKESGADEGEEKEEDEGEDPKPQPA